MKKFIKAFVLFSLSLTVNYQLPSTNLLYAASGTSGAQFLKLGAGARASAMGSAFTAISDDSTAIYWNPAGLNQLEDKSLSLMHALWFEDISYNWISYTHPTEIGSFGVGVQYVSYGKLTGIDRYGVATDNFSPTDLAITISYARKLAEIQMGLNLKYISSSIQDETATAFGADIGFIYDKLFNEKLAVGLAIQNIGTELKFITGGDPLPTTVKLGASYRVKENLIAALDIIKAKDSGVSFALGGEYAHKFNEELSGAARLGYNTLTRDITGLKGITAGLGVSYNQFALDYGFEPFGDLGITHRISFGVKF